MNGPLTWIRSLVGMISLLVLTALAGCNTHNGTPASYDPKEIVLVRVEPADGESDVPRNKVVKMTFNVPPLPESIDDQSILVRTGGTFQTRPEGSLIVSGNVVYFDPTIAESGLPNAIGFPAGAQILVEIPLYFAGSPDPREKFVQNIEGNPITFASGASEVAFTTGSGWDDPVAGPPGVLDLEFVPGPNSLGQVASHAAVTVIFSEPIDPGSIILGKNIFLTNNTAAAPTYKQGLPSVTFFDGSLTRYTFQPVFGFGQGPFNIKLNFIDPKNPASFSPGALPTDLLGNQIQNFTFLRTFDTQFDPSAVNTGLLREDFTSFVNRDAANTDALWGDDASAPFTLISQTITQRTQNCNIAAFMNLSGGTTVLPNDKPLGMGGTNPEGRYCPTANPLVGVGVPINVGNPPSSSGRRQQNLYRLAELGNADGTVTGAAWGPDSDALFAATYPDLIVRLGHKLKGTGLAVGSFFSQFDVDGYVTVADVKNYKVPQASDVNGGTINNGYFSWPAFDQFFEFNGVDELILDVESTEGTTWQQFRTFMAFDNPFGVCNCYNYFGCMPNNSIGLRQSDSTFGGDQNDPAPIPGTSVNPAPFVHVMQFTLAKLRSRGQSRWLNTGSDAPDFLTPIIAPLVQQGGATVTMYYSASSDAITEDVPFNTNINACDGNRYIRWRADLRSNLFTGARAKVALIEIPYTFP